MSSVVETVLNVAQVRRPRLITPQGLLVVAATVAAALALLFPGLDFGHPKFLAHPDELSIAYLNQVLQQRPEDRPGAAAAGAPAGGARQVAGGGGEPAASGR